MKNTLAIFFDKTNNLLDQKLKNYIHKNYLDFFYITDSISIEKCTEYAILHYTDIRMRDIDVLITNINDIYKIYNFSNNIILYFNNEKASISIDSDEYSRLISKVNKIIYDSNLVNIKVITEVLGFKGETEDVREYE